MKAVVAAFNQEKALVGAFSVITNLRMELFEALILTVHYEGGAGLDRGVGQQGVESGAVEAAVVQAGAGQQGDHRTVTNLSKQTL